MSWRVVLSMAALVACSRTEVVQGFPDSFVGVGLELRIDGDAPVVVRALPSGPADSAGVVPGDRILLIDGRPTDGMSLGEVVMRLRGQPDTQATLTMRRGGERLVVVVRRRAMAKGEKDYRPQDK